jgi:plastocyanin
MREPTSNRHRLLRAAVPSFTFMISLLFTARGFAAGASVNVNDNYFEDSASQSSVTTIHAGESVTWTWIGVNPHSSTSGTCPNGQEECVADGIWNSGTLGKGRTFTQTFPAAGTFPYFCVVHDKMRGSVVVEGSSGCGTITISPTTLPVGIRNVPYSRLLTASGGTAPYVFSVTAGSTPPGITLDAAGGLAGSPTAAGSFAFTATATDAAGCAGSLALDLVIAQPSPAGDPVVIPGVGSLAGAFGSNFRTQVQLTNAGTTPIAGSIVYHAGGASGSAGDPSVGYALGAHQTTNFDDLLTAMGLAGLGSADIVPAAGNAPAAVARIFNDGGDAGTAGFTEPVFRSNQALATGDSAVFILPSDPANYRFNLGVRSLGNGVSATFTIYDESGSPITAVSKSYPANFFVQSKSTDFLGVASLPTDGSLVIKISGGSGIFFGSTVDNRTQDTSTQFTQK